MGNILCSVGHVFSWATTQLCDYGREWAVDNETTKTHDYVPIKLYLQALKLDFHM